MSGPPADLDPEDFIICQGTYASWATWRAVSDGQTFRIEPLPVPIKSIAACNLLFLVVCFGFYWVLRYHTHGQAGAWAVIAPLAIALLTCGTFTGATVWIFQRERRLGPWLIYEAASGRVHLPREGVVFQRAEIICFQDITTKLLQWPGFGNNQRRSELNLITARAGSRRRWPLLRSSNTIRAFESVVKPLIAQTGLPVVRISDELLGWRLTKQPVTSGE